MRGILPYSLLLVLLLPVGGMAAEATPAPTEPRVTTTFTGADLIEALHRVFVGTGLRYEAPKNVPGPFALSVSDLPLEKALRLLLTPQGFVFQRDGDLYRITRKEDYQPLSDRLEMGRQEYLRRYWAALAQRPRKRPDRSNTRFLNLPDTINGSSSYSSQRLLSPMTMLPTREGPMGRTLNLGPLQLPLPQSVRMVPGGGVELYFPAEGDYSLSDGGNGMSFPYLGGGGLTLRLR